jgi:hypothetical protein
LFSEHNDVGINGKPDDSSGSASSAGAVNGLDEIAKRQCLLPVIGFHAMTISRETVQALWGVHLWGVHPTEELMNPAASLSMSPSPEPILIMTLGFGRLGVLTAFQPKCISEINLFTATGTRSGPVGNLLGNIDLGMTFGANNDDRILSSLLITGYSRSANRFFAT